MKILQVCAYDISRPGGVQRHVLALSAALQNNGHEVKIVAPGAVFDNENTASNVERKISISLAGTEFELSYLPRRARAHIIAKIQQWRPDVIHYHGLWVPFLPWQIFRAMRAPSVLTYHDTTAPGLVGSVMRAAFRVASRYFSNNIGSTIAVSQTVFAHLRFEEKDRPALIPPVVDLSTFHDIKRKTSVPPVVFCWGRLEPRKGIASLLAAIEIITNNKNNPPMKFVVAGSGRGASAVKTLQGKLGSSVLLFEPILTDATLLDCLSQASVVVAPALYGESFGIVLVEAMAAGVPIVAAANEGYKFVMRAVDPAQLVPPGDAVALAQGISTMIADTALQAKLSKLGRAYSKSFDVSLFVSQFEAQYLNAIAKYQRSKLDG